MRLTLTTCLVSGAMAMSVFAGETSFLREGDRWLFTGDSITYYDTYREAAERVARHFHPDADLAFWNRAVPGVTSDHKTDAKGNTPTIVSIMLGMNNTINSNWRYGMPMDVAGYKKGIAESIRQWKQAGATVILLTPTLTDENYDHGVYELRGTSAYLKGLGQACHELAKEEGCLVVPVQEEFESFQDSLALEQTLRVDGVHPSVLGQYQIARSLWSRMDLAAPLAGKGARTLREPPARLDVKMIAVRRFLTPEKPLPAFRLTAPTPVEATVTWSLGKARATEKLTLTPEGLEWTPKAPLEAIPATSGDRAQMVVDVQAGGRLALFIVDLLRTRVAHFKDGKVSGEILSETERPEGQRMGTWQAELDGTALFLAGEVFDSSNCPTDEWKWPFRRDGVHVWLDLRPTARFADVGVDADVSMTILEAREQPRFCCTLNPWVGRGMHLAAETGGEKTPTGYRWWLWVGGDLTKRQSQDFSKKDFVGINIWTADQDKDAAGSRMAFGMAIHPKLAADHYPNSFLILDMKNALPCDEVVNFHVFGP